MGELSFNFFNSIILAGIIQGFVFGIIWLFSDRYKSKRTLYLIALIVVYSLSNLQWLLLDIGVISTKSFYSYWFVPWALLMPPLLLFYGWGTINSNKKLPPYTLFTFLPFAIVFLINLSYKYKVIVRKEALNLSSFYREFPFRVEMVSVAFNLIIISLLFYQIKKRKKEPFSSHRVEPHLHWFTLLLIVLFFGTLLWGFSEIYFLDENENFYFYPLWILVSIIIYWMGHIGMYKYGIVQERKKIRSERLSFYSSPRKGVKRHNTIANLEQFIITERNFLNPQLTLEKTAQALQLSQGHLSKLINTELQQSFKEYLNQQRVEEAKLYLQNPDFSNYTLVAIGLEAGFNSKSTFNASFKKVTGLTPSQFKAQSKN